MRTCGRVSGVRPAVPCQGGVVGRACGRCLVARVRKLSDKSSKDLTGRPVIRRSVHREIAGRRDVGSRGATPRRGGAGQEGRPRRASECAYRAVGRAVAAERRVDLFQLYAPMACKCGAFLVLCSCISLYSNSLSVSELTSDRSEDLKRLSRSSGSESQSTRGCGGRGGTCLILLRKVLGFPGAIGCRHVLSHQAVGASLVHLRLTSYAVSPSILMLGRSRCRSASSRDGLSRCEGQLECGLAGSGQYARALWFRGLSCRPFRCWQGHAASI